MSKKAFEVYQYAAPAVFTPLSFWLWLRACGGNLPLTMMAWLLPIAFAYIVPGFGTNVFKVWEFDTRFRWGRFRPHHGFVFGSVTAMIARGCHARPAHDWADVIRLGFVLASVLGFWNTLYDIKAIESGILRVYNQPWAEGKGAEAVAMDYAPWIFAGFGGIYGAAIGIAELRAAGAGFSWGDFVLFFPLALAAAIAVPILGFRRHSLKTHGHSGCRPVPRKAH
jgi:hypothetical protein